MVTVVRSQAMTKTGRTTVDGDFPSSLFASRPPASCSSDGWSGTHGQQPQVRPSKVTTHTATAAAATTTAAAAAATAATTTTTTAAAAAATTTTTTTTTTTATTTTNNNNTRIERCNSRFLQTAHCPVSCLQYAHSSGQGAGAYHVQDVVCHLVWKDSSASMFHRVEIAFILVLIYWLNN